MSDLRNRLASLVSNRSKTETVHRVIIYSKADCHLCEEAKAVLMRVRTQVPFTFEEVDITSDEALFKKYEVAIPVVLVDGVERFRYRVDERRLLRVLSG